MKPAFEDDLLASAIVALAHHMRPAPEGAQLARAALKVMAMPAKNFADETHRLHMLKAVMGFGPVGSPLGRA